MLINTWLVHIEFSRYLIIEEVRPHNRQKRKLPLYDKAFPCNKKNSINVSVVEYMVTLVLF